MTLDALKAQLAMLDEMAKILRDDLKAREAGEKTDTPDKMYLHLGQFYSWTEKTQKLYVELGPTPAQDKRLKADSANYMKSRTNGGIEVKTTGGRQVIHYDSLIMLPAAASAIIVEKKNPSYLSPLLTDGTYVTTRQLSGLPKVGEILHFYDQRCTREHSGRSGTLRGVRYYVPWKVTSVSPNGNFYLCRMASIDGPDVPSHVRHYALDHGCYREKPWINKMMSEETRPFIISDLKPPRTSVQVVGRSIVTTEKTLTGVTLTLDDNTKVTGVPAGEEQLRTGDRLLIGNKIAAINSAVYRDTLTIEYLDSLDDDAVGPAWVPNFIRGSSGIWHELGTAKRYGYGDVFVLNL